MVDATEIFFDHIIVLLPKCFSCLEDPEKASRGTVRTRSAHHHCTGSHISLVVSVGSIPASKCSRS